MYNVTWHEPGSSNTMEPYANVHHLDALTVYERRLEASTQSDYCKALYLLQRNKERSAITSEDDTDSEMSEPEKISQQSNGASTSQEASVAPSLSCPSSQKQSEWEDLLEAGTWIQEGPNWVMVEELYQSTSVLDLTDKPLLGPALDWRKL
jgi:hypothetical protein